MLKKILPYFLIIAFFSGCREDVEPVPYTYSQLLTGKNWKSWKMIGLQYRENGKPIETYNLELFTDPQSLCIFDDLYIFYANDERLFEVDEGGTKCNPDDPQTFLTSNWALVNANATIEFVIPLLIPFPYPYVLQELSENRMVAEVYFTDNTQSYRMIFKAIKEQ